MQAIEYFDEYLSAFHRGVEERDLPPCAIEDQSCFDKNAVYYESVLLHHLDTCSQVEVLDDLNSAICRCVEHGLINQLRAILTKLPALLDMATHADGCDTLDRTLMLRKVDLPSYLVAKAHGFVDVELEKRIAIAQRMIKGTPVQCPIIYEGPSWTSKGYQKPRYWGYRQTIYYLRYNPESRYKALTNVLRRGLSPLCWWGNCCWSAYKDFVENGNSATIDKFARIVDM